MGGATLLAGRLEGVDDQTRAVVVGHRVADDLAGGQVQPAGEGEPALDRREVMSPTSLVPGVSAWKSRPIRSGAGRALLSGRVSERRWRRWAP